MPVLSLGIRLVCLLEKLIWPLPLRLRRRMLLSRTLAVVTALTVAVLLARTDAASPPDVRRGYAPPLFRIILIGLGPWFGLCPQRCLGQRPNQGPSPKT
jgi:hypothetical protein